MRELLAAFEKALDPAHPERAGFGCRVIGYGEVSAVLVLGDLPDRVLKRMSGFPSPVEAEEYARVVRDYLAALAALGLPRVETELLALATGAGRHVVYLVQPRLAEEELGHRWLARASDLELFELVERALEGAARVLRANSRRSDGLELAIDPQLSNWAWRGPGAAPVLLDVGTPFVRRHGALEMGRELLLRAYPAPVRIWLRRQRSVEQYIGKFFRLEQVILDLLGNFAKEGFAARIDPALRYAADWLAAQPEAESAKPPTRERVRAYYQDDAATLELSLRARRAARWLHRATGRRYDFILPGRIERSANAI